MKLTKSVKEDIKKRMVAEVMRERNTEQLKKEHALAELIYNAAYGVYLPDMKRLPPGFFTFCEKMYVPSPTGGYIVLEMGRARAFPASALPVTGTPTVFDVSEELQKRAQLLYEERAEVNSTRRRLIKMVDALLDSVTTTNKLLEIWPEGEAWIPPAPVVDKRLPAVRADNLNEFIGQLRAGAGS